MNNNSTHYKFQYKTSKQLQAVASELPLTLSEKLTYRVLAGHASGKNRSCFPSNRRLSRLTGFCIRTIVTHLKKLMMLGIIKRRRRYDICKDTGQARQKSSTTWFQSDKITQFARLFRGLRANPAHPFNQLKKRTNTSNFNPKQRTEQGGHATGDMIRDDFSASPNSASILQSLKRQYFK